ncbi:hypothetical protein GOP47_0001408 [Adiantum capillus-veneris]|uniref:Uncharacterized protein n=1 Tax=Adiantum capillus-veneris TaxID=13818 RepID=A0A9D4V900_ADICA|nr:hypothetical protein GOP47_0001408 [Adiantum capillus-veneris]
MPMALSHAHKRLAFFLVTNAIIGALCCKASGSRPHHALRHTHSHAWFPATATWYGGPYGDGSDGGACGYGTLARTPYGTHVSAASPVLFRNGEGCGACYQVKCIGGGCSEVGLRVVITDECPGGYCAFGRTHFDMSGSAFGRLASSHNEVPTLLNEGLIHVLYRRVACSYHGREIAFQVNQGATNYWFSMLVRYEAGDGDLSTVQLMEGQSQLWINMEHLWGAYWCLNGGPFRAPFSIRITSSSGSTLTARNAIPYNWVPGQIYTSTVNFP